VSDRPAQTVTEITGSYGWISEVYFEATANWARSRDAAGDPRARRPSQHVGASQDRAAAPRNASASAIAAAHIALASADRTSELERSRRGRRSCSRGSMTAITSSHWPNGWRAYGWRCHFIPSKRSASDQRTDNQRAIDGSPTRPDSIGGRRGLRRSREAHRSTHAETSNAGAAVLPPPPDALLSVAPGGDRPPSARLRHSRRGTVVSELGPGRALRVGLLGAPRPARDRGAFSAASTQSVRSTASACTETASTSRA
jgi:hypothetical protein